MARQGAAMHSGGVLADFLGIRAGVWDQAACVTLGYHDSCFVVFINFGHGHGWVWSCCREKEDMESACWTLEVSFVIGLRPTM
jgi:hypothetical protein